MKKILMMFILLLGLFICSSCNDNYNEQNYENNIEDDEVFLENIKYKLNQEDSGYGIKYNIASNFRKSVMTNAINYFSEEIDGSSYFVIRIYSYPNKSIEYAIKDSVENYDSKEEVQIGDLTYTKVGFTNYNGAKTYLYYYKYKKTVYTFVFTSSIDLSRLSDIFIKSVIYE